jgi:hypothetical protein
LRCYHADCEQTWSISTRFQDALSGSWTLSTQRLPLSSELSRQSAFHRGECVRSFLNPIGNAHYTLSNSHAASLSSLVCTGNKTQETHRLLLLHACPFLPCSTRSASYIRTPMQDRHALAPPSLNEHVHSTIVSKQAVFPERARRNDPLGGCYSRFEHLSAL